MKKKNKKLPGGRGGSRGHQGSIGRESMKVIEKEKIY